MQKVLKPFGLAHFSTDAAGVYARHLPAAAHTVGKVHTQQLARKHLTLRTRIKRLTRQTICFSKSVFMHDTVIGLFVNRYEFGTPISLLRSTTIGEHYRLMEGALCAPYEADR